ncbi:1-aminocyclopropane-1-carboxylate deaminase/D-cysteine desulfhydrase [Stutzerimonas stutzeri]|uniref:1-aminocyclopropane-1-carboxylate deaminase/D-cysteine desulfhydrase n=1 Tax=Stutzerimonas stutzeri TaxID=316 RepID=UPI00056FB7CB|nr:pyridoxal-phosphate dependent enzyme [Stutzerimonas stutzeri]MCQ4330631.1 pyridoxal-phosphate dependent enzyme [Stutzerimonas stutzeri]
MHVPAFSTLSPEASLVPLQPVDLPWLQQANVQLAVLRLDLIDPELSGNKWFKLVHHLHAAQAAGAPGLISLGGPHSNHLHALAASAKRFGLASVGLVRGHPQRTATAEDLQGFGMQLHWLGYAGYRARHQPNFFDAWRQRYPNYHCIPEGGGGLAGALGCSPLVLRVREQLAALGWNDYDGWWLAAGTGTTLAGLVIGEAGQGNRRVHGAMAGPPSHGVAQEVGRLLGEAGLTCANYQLIDASRGGFGQFDEALARFMVETERATGLPLEPVYTAKAMMALRLYVERGYFAPGTRLIFVHTGGLQGRRDAQAQLDELLR